MCYPRQWGFIESTFISENLTILEGLIRMSKTDKKTLAVVFIDLAKAFDSLAQTQYGSAGKEGSQ